jgi:hypothetical protein
MPPKRKAATTNAAPASKRVASFRARRAPNRLGDDPVDPPRQPTPLDEVRELQAALEAYQRDSDERFAQIDASAQHSASKVDELTNHMNELFGTLMDKIDTRLPQPPPAPTSGPLPGNSPNARRDVLSRWPWVDKTLIQNVANGEFDIYQLPKLHREETFRNRHIAKSIDGVNIPAHGGIPTIVHGSTKLQSTFKDLSSFLQAWLIYVSIRVSYAPERGSGLAFWTECLVFHAGLKYEFPVVLDYVINYFQSYQDSDPDDWFNIDSELHSNTFGNAAQKSLHVTVNPSGKSKAPIGKQVNYQPIPINDQVCLNWNRKSVGCKVKELHGTDCKRRHVCNACQEPGHKSFQCPKATASS